MHLFGNVVQNVTLNLILAYSWHLLAKQNLTSTTHTCNGCVAIVVTITAMPSDAHESKYEAFYDCLSVGGVTYTTPHVSISNT